MPYANLSADSCLLLVGGWSRVSDQTNPVEAWGADRHGKWFPEIVRFSPINDEQPIYLGTQSGFGALAASTKLTTSNGATVMAKALVERLQIADTWFELPNDCATNIGTPDADVVLQELRRSASFVSGNKFAIKRSWPNGAAAIALDGVGYDVQIGGSVFYILSDQSINMSLATDWSNTLCQIVFHCFTNEEGDQEIDRMNCTLISWFVAALHRKRHQFEFIYQSLQHTSTVRIRQTQLTLPPVIRGGCACKGSLAIPAKQIEWSATGWNPVASGFFIKGT